jgi:hypothetical protein
MSGNTKTLNQVPVIEDIERAIFRVRDTNMISEVMAVYDRGWALRSIGDSSCRGRGNGKNLPRLVEWRPNLEALRH